MTLKYRELKRRYELDGAQRTVGHLSEALREGHLRAEDFSIRDLAEALVPDGGEWVRMLDPRSTGSVTLTLSSEMNAGSVLVDGASATATISRVGQRARMTFDGTAGQIVSLGINSTTLQFWSTLTVYKPDGSVLVSNNSITTDTNNHMVLPVTGTYSIVIDPGSTSTGSATLTLSSEINGGSLTINGASRSAHP